MRPDSCLINPRAEVKFGELFADIVTLIFLGALGARNLRKAALQKLGTLFWTTVGGCGGRVSRCIVKERYLI